MRTAVFSTKAYDRSSFLAAQDRDAGLQHDLTFLAPALTIQTVPLAAGFPAVCLFVNDRADGAVLERVAAGGTRVVALRCAGFNNVDLVAAKALGLTVVRVPAYSPYATAEHAVTLMLGLSTIPVSMGHAEHGDPGVMVALTEWAQSIVYLHPNPELLQAVDGIFKTHLFFGMTVFLLFPFTRLVHVWSIPLGYLGRPYQIVRTKRIDAR